MSDLSILDRAELGVKQIGEWFGTEGVDEEVAEILTNLTAAVLVANSLGVTEGAINSTKGIVWAAFQFGRAHPHEDK